jgi:putative spermidine/putrescine transport system substrate-binding protein
MGTYPIGRRAFLGGAVALGASTVVPRPARAAGSVVAAVYPSEAWEGSYRAIVGPHLKRTANVEVVFTPLLALDQVSKAMAARGNPPFDVFILDPGPRISAIEAGLFEKFDASKLKNLAHVPPGLADEHGIAIAAQIVGIVYNPKKVERPTGWKDLFTAKYHGRLGLTGFGTTFGTVSLIEIAKVFGGSETNVEPAFEALRKILPHVTVVTNPVAIGPLLQQGQIDITYTNYQFVATLKAKGLDIEFAKPDTGAVAFYTTLHVAKNAANRENAYRYIDAVLTAEVQGQLQKPPYNILSVNKQVALRPDVPPELLQSHEELTRFVTHDWRKINQLRAGWIERFNKEVRK